MTEGIIFISCCHIYTKLFSLRQSHLIFFFCMCVCKMVENDLWQFAYFYLFSYFFVSPHTLFLLQLTWKRIHEWFIEQNALSYKHPWIRRERETAECEMKGGKSKGLILYIFGNVFQWTDIFFLDKLYRHSLTIKGWRVNTIMVP